MDGFVSNRRSPRTDTPRQDQAFVSDGVSSTDSPFVFENVIENEKLQLAPTSKSRHHIVLSAMVVCLPMMLLCAALLAIVFVYEVRPTENIFDVTSTSSIWKEYDLHKHLLVNFSDTKIVFIASFLSTIAPLLASCVMAIASVSLLGNLRRPSLASRDGWCSEDVRNPLLIGLSTGSYWQLISSAKYIARNPRARMRRTIFWASALLLLTLLFSIAVTVADAALHMLTETVDFTLYLPSSAPAAQNGRGMNEFCASFDRVDENYGFPCTYPNTPTVSDPNQSAEKAESQKLAHNNSDIAEIRIATLPGSVGSSLAFLIPKSITIDPTLDYQADTIGFSTQCSIIPASSCNLTRWGPYDHAYTSFNCSNNFWGSIGLAVNTSAASAIRQPSPYIPFLGLKPQPNLQYGFYADSTLETVFNAAGINDSQMLDPNLDALTDEELPTSIYMAFAWRSTWSSFFGAPANEMITANLTGVYNDTYWLDYFLNCKVAAYDVDYVWADGNIQSVSASIMNNGTILDMWQGTTSYRPTISGGGIALQDINAQASVAGTTIAAYTGKFGELLSQQALAVVGGFTAPRAVTRQQSRESILLARVPKVALGALIGSSLLYPVLGVFLLFKALYSLRQSGEELNGRRPARTVIYTTRPISQHSFSNKLPTTTTSGIVGGGKTYRNSPPSRVDDRNSTAGLRYMLWGNAGVGPNLDHLRFYGHTTESADSDL